MKILTPTNLINHGKKNLTDNIFTLRQWCSNNFPQAKEQLENMYQEVSLLIFHWCLNNCATL